MVSARQTQLNAQPGGSTQPSHPCGSQDSTPRQTSCNVRVMVRCRPDSEQEKHSNAFRVVQTKPHQKEVTVTQTIPGRQVASHNKTYSFDGVFPQNSTQFEIFQQVTNPLIQEVLAGFNCTVFAYGQTGTGKTYTMEGQMEGVQEETGRLPTQAGIIPRAVHAIFEALALGSSAEYSVRVAYLEIYNEELCDLLNDGPDQRLRILEDPMGKKGMMVDKLEDIPVTRPEDIMTILTNAQKKRRTAETQMNTCSSRSHCIFTITIAQKELHLEGAEEIIRMGKLNLVDLAGSENIARSGADMQTVRTKEAGMINTSLLALGRVITALVDRAAYVPYRDSKLTRLLQDSLGGHTKTVMVAAISPSSMNLEETLSTLDYAHRAKNIKNTPQLNQKMSKQVMMRAMQSEKDQLTMELRAIRQRDGVWLSEGRHKAFEDEIGMRNRTMEQMESTLACVTNQLRHLREDHEKDTMRLTECRGNRQRFQKEFDQNRELLDKELTELRKNQRAVDIEARIHESLRTNEQHVLSKMNKTKAVLERSSQDITALHEKLDRQRNVVSANVTNAQELQKLVRGEISTRASHTNLKVNAHAKAWKVVANLIDEWRKMERTRLEARSGQLTKITDLNTAEFDEWFAQLASQESRSKIVWDSLSRRCDELYSVADKFATEIARTTDDMGQALEILEQRFVQWHADSETTQRERGLEADGDTEELVATCDNLRENLRRGLTDIADRRKVIIGSLKEQMEGDLKVRKEKLVEQRAEWQTEFLKSLQEVTAHQDREEDETVVDIITQLSALDDHMEADKYSMEALLSKMSTQSESAVSSAAASRVARSQASVSARSAVEASRISLRNIRDGPLLAAATATKAAAENSKKRVSGLNDTFAGMKKRVCELRQQGRVSVQANYMSAVEIWNNMHDTLNNTKQLDGSRHDQLSAFSAQGQDDAIKFGEAATKMLTEDALQRVDAVGPKRVLVTGETPARPEKPLDTTEFEFALFPPIATLEDKFTIAGEPDVPFIEADPPSPTFSVKSNKSRRSRKAKTPKTNRKHDVPQSNRSRKARSRAGSRARTPGSVKSQKRALFGKQAKGGKKNPGGAPSGSRAIQEQVRKHVKKSGQKSKSRPRSAKKIKPPKGQFGRKR